MRLRSIAAALFFTAVALIAPATAAQRVPVKAHDPAGKQLVERLRGGGLILFFRHADTAGMPCDRTFRVGDRGGQRNISATGQVQSRRIGEAITNLGIPIAYPVLAGPVFRARDTAELAFGRERVEVTDSLLADDYSGERLQWVLAEHRRLFNDPVAGTANRVLVGHRTPAIMVLGDSVGGKAFPEGAALVLEPSSGKPQVLGILMFAPIPGGGFHSC